MNLSKAANFLAQMFLSEEDLQIDFQIDINMDIEVNDETSLQHNNNINNLFSRTKAESNN